MAGMNVVRQFLEQYFVIYDSDNRQPLLDAYHEQAMFSMTVPPVSQTGNKMECYWKNNRNLRRQMNNDDYKMKFLKVGRLAIVSTLAELPKTTHDRNTFTVDLMLFTRSMVNFVVTGIFLESDTENRESSNSAQSTNELRYFTRTFLIVPQGNGYCILNEQVFISNTTTEQLRTYKRPNNENPLEITANTSLTEINTNLSSSLENRLQISNISMPIETTPLPVATSPASPDGTVAAGAIINDATKLQMVHAIIAQTNMNFEWSKKCLEETNWDFNHAVFVFNKLLIENKIPPEAFVK